VRWYAPGSANMSKVEVHEYSRSCTTNRDTARGSKLLCLSLISILTITRLANSGPWLLHLESPKITSQLCAKSVSEIKTVMLVFGTRPEAVKMAPVIMEISKRPDLRSITVSTGPHKEMLGQVLLDFDLQDSLDYELNLMSQGQTLSELSARAITSISSVISSECPDVVLVQGDTTTAFMAALAAFYAKIPVGHIEAGLRTHDIYAPFPEEVNRQSISTMSTFNFAPTELAAENLRSEGRSQNVFVTGNTVVDALKIMQDRPRSTLISDVLKVAESRALPFFFPKIILLTAHRRENLGRPLMNIFDAVSAILKGHEDVVVIYPIYLNPAVASSVRERFGELSFEKLQAGEKFSSDSSDKHLNRLLLVPPVHHADLVALLQTCHLVMTDSGGIEEEGITLGKPILVLRDTTERPEGVLAGVSKLVGTDAKVILEWADKLLSDDVFFGQMSNSSQLFGDGTAGKQIVDLLENNRITQGKFEYVS
jgi:UDP-N-acetylglucosamine 2-epimerase (non-hydrolysing)